jgi:hypothetical protein
MPRHCQGVSTAQISPATPGKGTIREVWNKGDKVAKDGGAKPSATRNPDTWRARESKDLFSPRFQNAGVCRAEKRQGRDVRIV